MPLPLKDAADLITQTGFNGALVLVLLTVILYVFREHRAERREERKNFIAALERVVGKIETHDERTRKANDAILAQLKIKEP